MIELKVYIDPKEGPCWRKFYEKTEADKVIADLDSRNAQLRRDKANLLRNNENLKLEIKTQKLGRLNDKIQYQITERHHKYKRCLEMARWCAEMKGKFVKQKWFEKATFWRKWQDKWLELAEKFKPNKSTAQ